MASPPVVLTRVRHPWLLVVPSVAARLGLPPARLWVALLLWLCAQLVEARVVGQEG